MHDFEGSSLFLVPLLALLALIVVVVIAFVLGAFIF